MGLKVDLKEYNTQISVMEGVEWVLKKVTFKWIEMANWRLGKILIKSGRFWKEYLKKANTANFAFCF